MTRLNQIVAIVAGKKTRLEKDLGDLNKTLQKQDLFNGTVRKYAPIEDGGETLPQESKIIQKSVKQVFNDACTCISDIMDVVATQERSNCEASADLMVDGKMIVSKVPVTVLLYIEKQLNDLNTFVSNAPTLDPAERWKKDENSGNYVSEPVSTHRTKKIQKPIVLYQATEQHPAQTQLITEDVVAGYWTAEKSSTAIPATEKQQILGRIAKLQEATKLAREEANNSEAVNMKIAQPLLSFIFS